MNSDEKSLVIERFTEACAAMNDVELRAALIEYGSKHPGSLTRLRQLLARPRGGRKWLCPECGSMGVSDSRPVCHERGCDYRIECVEISDRVYGKRVGVPEDIAARALINAGNAMGDPGTRAWLIDRADRIKAGTVLI